ncbi:MAG: IPT/TIG domain-containing protein, partial [Thaumarchaeota archaeon]|nr:IPT/TIG domain-containing protein [Nitrososphaerota archaeon]
MLYQVSGGILPVYAATLSLTPNTGAVGTTVTISGTAFKANTNVAITYDGTTLTTNPTTVKTNGAGAFSATFIVPSSGAGNHTVTASQTGPGSVTLSTTFTVTTPVINAAVPTSGPVGTTVSFNFNNLIAGASYTIKFGTTTASGAQAT